MVTLVLTLDKPTVKVGDTVVFTAVLAGATPNITTNIDLKYESAGIWKILLTNVITIDIAGNATTQFTTMINQAGTFNIKATAGGTLDSNTVSLTADGIAPTPLCAIATAAFGTPLAPQLGKLRNFRDKCLPQSLTRLYYTISPSFALKIQQHSKLKYVTRQVLDIFL